MEIHLLFEQVGYKKIRLLLLRVKHIVFKAFSITNIGYLAGFIYA